LSKEPESPLRLLEERKKDPSVIRAVALGGDYSFLQFSEGASELNYAEAVKPSFPGKIHVEDLTFDREGYLDPDPYPHGWDNMDWKVYSAMRDPTVSYREVGNTLGVSWMTVKRHFEKIMKDCKVMMAFFPEGYRGYDQVLFTFETTYEIGLKEALEKIDRSSYLWKYNDTIILTLFVDKYNDTCEHFKELEENGVIHGLRISIPMKHYVSVVP
jgi:hypothetical protein